MPKKTGKRPTPLLDAYWEKDWRRFHQLLSAGAEPDERDDNGFSLLFNCLSYSIKPEYARAARALLDAGADLATGFDAISGVAQSGDESLVRQLLQAGADPNLAAGWGGPLEAAARRGFVGIVMALIEAGADLNGSNATGGPLQEAIKESHEDCACFLIEAGANIKVERRSPIFFPFNPLCEAAFRGQARTVAALLKRSASLEDRAKIFTQAQIPTYDNATPLAIAAGEGHLEITRLMLEPGAKRATVDLESRTTHIDWETVVSPPPKVTERWDTGKDGKRILTSQTTEYPDPTPQYRNVTPLMLAAAKSHLEIVRVLVEAGAKVEAVDDTCRTAIDHARERNHKEIVKYLDRVGGSKAAAIDPNLRLLYAAETGDAQGVRQALAAGAKVDAYDEREKSSGRTALMLATMAGHDAILKALLDAGATVDRREQTQQANKRDLAGMAKMMGFGHLVKTMPGALGLTALMLAAWAGHPGAVRTLLAAGADPSLRDNLDNTAHSIAERKQHQAIVALLPETAPAPKPKNGLPNGTQTPAKPKSVPRRLSASALRPYRRPAVVKRFRAQTAKIDWSAVLRWLEKLCGAKPKKEDWDVDCHSCHVHTGKSVKTAAVQDKFLTDGCFVFAADEDSKGRPTRLFVLPTTDKYDALAMMGTNAANFDMGTLDIIRWLMELEQEQPFIITRITHDLVAGLFTKPIRDPDGLAERMYQFCPDIVDQGCGNVPVLADELRRKPARFFFWWD
jgi:ankyrin repeat protein